MSNEVIREKVDKIKKALGNRCFFCENELEGETKEVFLLFFCKTCYGKYELDKELNEKRETNGFGAK
jgi:hypothetical protein